MSSVDEQVIDFQHELFDRIFTQPFRPQIKERLRQDAVARQVQEAAGAASPALTRFFLSQQLTEAPVAEILRGFVRGCKSAKGLHRRFERQRSSQEIT